MEPKGHHGEYLKGRGPVDEKLEKHHGLVNRAIKKARDEDVAKQSGPSGDQKAGRGGYN